MVDDNDFGDLFLKDLVHAGCCIARKKLEYLGPSPFLRGLLRRDTQATIDPEDRGNTLLETALGYAGVAPVFKRRMKISRHMYVFGLPCLVRTCID